MADPCPICSRPDAPAILEGLKNGDRAAHRVAQEGDRARGEKEIAWSSFGRALAAHRSLPAHDAVAVISAKLAAAEPEGSITVGPLLQRLEHLLGLLEGILKDVTGPNSTEKGQNKALIIREARQTIESMAKLSGQLIRVHAHQHHVEVTGPNGGPVQIAAIVQQLPDGIQALHAKAEAGDHRAGLLLDRYSRTGEEELDGQIRATRAFLQELEEEAYHRPTPWNAT